MIVQASGVLAAPAGRYAGAVDQLDQQRARGRSFQIFDHVRFDAGIADQAERVARRAAHGVVIDHDIDGHGRPFSSRG
ncbi:hypothetical protein BES08_29815 (plasmid) [Novosphingobium resinovorum]|jgi:hypothetical protein|uniref:Uncharacterized protein n=1 Tax=Novosphingobium resinovorum TaxID=158500 RepID=A0A1D8AG51_9SPHN|nr:hypothetical protein BES08_29815 [Novosphingobium resinovorum]MBB3588513.1 hypothetical protein [Sphingomonas sp. BK481]